MKLRAFLRSMVITVTLALTVGIVQKPVFADGILKGSSVVDQEDVYETKIASVGDIKVTIQNAILTVYGSSSYTFKIGALKSVVDSAVINEDNELLHILTLSGSYYVLDLRTGVSIPVYRNRDNGKYCSSANTKAYAVSGKSLINRDYFYEIVMGEVTSRELLMVRSEYDALTEGKDPSTEQPEKQPETQQPEKQPETQQPEKQPETQQPETTTSTTTSSITDSHTESLSRWEWSEIWKAYIDGKLTWEQLTVITSQFGWETKHQETNESYTNYVYDESGKLIQEHTVTTTSGSEQGTGKENETQSQSGKAETEVTVIVTGSGLGTSETETKEHTESETVTNAVSTSTGSDVKVKKKWYVTRTAGKKRTKLFFGKKLKAILILKNGTQIYNGKRMKGVLKNCFAAWQKAAIVIKKSGAVMLYNGRNWKQIAKGGKKFLTDNRGLATKVVLKEKAVKIKTLARKSKVKFYN